MAELTYLLFPVNIGIELTGFQFVFNKNDSVAFLSIILNSTFIAFSRAMDYYVHQSNSLLFYYLHNNQIFSQYRVFVILWIVYAYTHINFSPNNREPNNCDLNKCFNI